jgi:hypothetical protein
MKKMIGLLALSSLLLAMAPAAFAQPRHLTPGSVLIYPLYDSTPGAGTIICVTNTNDSRLFCPDSDFREGDIMVHYQYIDGETCQEFDRFEFLTPGDTTCVLADLHNPEQDLGFLVVSATDVQDMSRKVDFDYLIGSAIIVQSELNFLWSYTPYVFTGNPRESKPSYCDRVATDDDNDGALDFDGVEYDVFPRELFIDSFFEEKGVFGNKLTLLTTVGPDYTAEINFLFWNNIEEKFSRSFRMICWVSLPLSEISAIVKNLGGDPDELGFQDVQTGWASIRGSRTLDGSGNPVDRIVPPLLGVFNQFIKSSDFSSGNPLHYRGTLDGGEILVGNGY